MNILIKNVHIQGEPGNVRKDIYIAGNRIAGIGSCPEDFRAETVIDGSKKTIMPGLANAHTHAYMSVFRNYADDIPFAEWLFEKINPIEDQLTPEEGYWGNMLSFAEMIRTGTTCFADMHMITKQSVKAANDAGIRGAISRCVVGSDRNDPGFKRRFEECLDEMEYAKSIGSNALFMISPHAIYTCGPDVLRFCAEKSEELDLPIHIHMAETAQEFKDSMEKYGCTPIEHIAECGILDRKVLMAHCVRLTEHDMELMAVPNVYVATNPSSNMKLANGFAPVPEMLSAGINVALGTDSAASNNSLNMFNEMRMLSMIHKGTHEDALVLSAADTLKIATENGYKAVGYEDGGKIEEGCLADVVLIDEEMPALKPNFDITSALVYSASGYEVSDVIIDGKPVMRNRELLTIDEERLYYEIGRITANWPL
ncbi:MAG: amidohydrolase [Lachnospiraceae bacterium]|jgi:5-methylthioadenosine/S-adenosylhomocysteine deaminase